MPPNDITNIEHYIVLYVVALLVASVLLFYNIFNKSTNMKWLSWRYRKPKLDVEQVSIFSIIAFHQPQTDHPTAGYRPPSTARDFDFVVYSSCLRFLLTGRYETAYW